VDVLERHLPRIVSGRTGSLGVGLLLSLAQELKDPLGGGRVCCRMLEMLAIWVIGWVNERTYWMNAWISPTVIALRIASQPPRMRRRRSPGCRQSA
jgi:hypothetical protein